MSESLSSATDFCNVKSSLPYPEVQAFGPHLEYARAMLSNMAGSNSEMSAISLYFYDSLVLKSAFSAYAQCFERINEQEMHHLEIFGTLAQQLGADPRLWSYHGHKKAYWTPQYNRYTRDVRQLLVNAIEAERAAIRQYSRQADTIRDANVVANLRRIIVDEERHLAIFMQMLEQTSSP